MKLFGTDGIRGRANHFPVTAEMALRLGRALAAELAGQPRERRTVVIGRDTRLSGPMLESALTAGLLSGGVDVIAVGELPTPAVAFLTRSLSAGAGVMLTASHNPFEDNGMKIFGGDGYKLSDAREAAIEAALLAPEAPQATLAAGELGRCRPLADGGGRYLDSVKKALGDHRLDGVKIVVDCGHGATSVLAPDLFRGLGAEVIALSCEPNGININDGCGALHPEKAAALVREHRADLGVAFDGDADRVIFIDGEGRVVSGDKVLALCALGLKKNGKLRNDTLVATVMSNLGLREAMGRHGIRVVATAVGDRHVLEAIRENGHNFGGENSGHLIFSDHATTGDGILSALWVMRLIRESGASLAELSEVMREYPSRLLNLPVRSKPPLADLPGLQALMAEAGSAFGETGRHLIRYSGTENKIRVLVEHCEQASVDEWIARFQHAIEQELG